MNSMLFVQSNAHCCVTSRVYGQQQSGTVSLREIGVTIDKFDSSVFS